MVVGGGLEDVDALTILLNVVVAVVVVVVVVVVGC